jgi:hypothetical protein
MYENENENENKNEDIQKVKGLFNGGQFVIVGSALLCCFDLPTAVSVSIRSCPPSSRIRMYVRTYICIVIVEFTRKGSEFK